MVEWQFSPAFSPLLLLEAVEGLEGTINFIPKGCLQNDLHVDTYVVFALVNPFK